MLGMPVGAMMSSMSAREYLDWVEYLEWKNGKQTPDETLAEIQKCQALIMSVPSSSISLARPRA
jgi:hypothetical protein